MNLSQSQNYQPPSEPLEIRMYGLTMSLPTWLVLQMASYVFLLLMLVGCYQVLVPSTATGEHFHQTLKNEPYALYVLSWAPTGLFVIGAVELCETTVGLFLFRKKWVERNFIEEN